MSDDANTLVDFAKHLLLFVVGLAVASIVTGFYVNTLLHFDPEITSGSLGNANEFVPFALFIALMVSLYAFPFAALVVALGEHKSWRMWWYYALAGAVIGLFLGWMFANKPWFPWAGLGFGPIAGVIYWAIAGRRAGQHAGTRALTITLGLLGIVTVALLYGPILR